MTTAEIAISTTFSRPERDCDRPITVHSIFRQLVLKDAWPGAEPGAPVPC